MLYQPDVICYAINAEATPTESAWEKGIALAKQTIDTYKQRHNDSIPRKVSYTLWSSEFIETGGGYYCSSTVYAWE